MPRTTIMEKLNSGWREKGFAGILRQAYRSAVFRISRRLNIRTPDPVDERREQLAREIDTALGRTVKYGPFRGLRLGSETSWGGLDRPSMLLGLYELEVLQRLEQIPRRYDVFVDLGAADGYYGLGVLINGLFRKSYCFEMSPEGRKVIEANARENGLVDRVVVKGLATRDFHDALSAEEADRAVLLVDIEGGEFELLEQTHFRVFRGSIFIIELHERTDQAAEKVDRLVEAARQTHRARFFTTGARDLSGIPELQRYCDNDRWLMCSEGRPQLMRWLELTPV